jgi:outer membrane biosynthesis protein TonB
MKRPLIYSATLHFTVLILLVIGFYNPFEKKRSLETPMMIEFVQVAEQSAAPVLAPEVIKEAQQPAPPKPTPAPTPPQPMPEPVQPEPAPQPKPEPEHAKPEPVKPEEPKPVEAEPIPDPKAKEKPKDKPKEKPQEEKQKQKAEITLDKKKKPKTKPDEKKDDKKKDKKSKSATPTKTLDDILNEVESEAESKDEGAPSAGKGAPAETIGPVLTGSEIDALRRHFSRCWLVPSGLRDAKNIVVPIKIKIGRDGTVKNAEIQDKGRMNSDITYRTAAESAQRAVMDPNCSPLPIPQDKFEKFKEMIFKFDPKEMF